MEKARTFCKNNHGDLATIGSNSERKFLWKRVRGNLAMLYNIWPIYPAAYACDVQGNVLVA